MNFLRRLILSEIQGMLKEADAGPGSNRHPDDIAVDRFADAMKEKLAKKRIEGRGGWHDPEQCGVDFLAQLLHEHVHKGDPVDVGNLAMMLFNRGASTALLNSSAAPW